MRKSQIFDFAFHSFDQNSLVGFLLDNPDHSGILTRRNDPVGKIIAWLVSGDKLPIIILEFPSKINDIANLQLGRAEIMISWAWNDDNLQNKIYYTIGLQDDSKYELTSLPLMGKLSMAPLNCIMSFDEAAAALNDAKKDEPSMISSLKPFSSTIHVKMRVESGKTKLFTIASIP